MCERRAAKEEGKVDALGQGRKEVGVGGGGGFRGTAKQI